MIVIIIDSFQLLKNNYNKIILVDYNHHQFSKKIKTS